MNADVQDTAMPAVASREAWLSARRKLLAQEKAFNIQRDALTEARRRLPRVLLEKNYVFEGPEGRRSLADLFQGRRQLIVYHFMFDSDWDEGCPACSFVADHFDGTLPHLAARDTAFAAVSRAPIAKIEAFRKRMGWKFPWLSSHGTDFNHDFRVTIDAEHAEYNYAPVADQPEGYPHEGEREGLSVFVREGKQLFHSYSTYQRGLDLFLNTYNFLDVTPLGRQEADGIMRWVRHHDRY
ncbi:MAG TPA: DUF899 domain-containing protein [Burkholderiales bacterium]|nr:DUF899 domain-containing protein [Burkholderiales bacterium]